VRYTSTGLQSFELAVPVKDHKGTLAIHLSNRQQGTLAYRLNGASTSCAGRISLEVTESTGSGGGSGGIGAIGSWSASISRSNWGVTRSVARRLRSMW